MREHERRDRRSEAEHRQGGRLAAREAALEGEQRDEGPRAEQQRHRLGEIPAHIEVDVEVRRQQEERRRERGMAPVRERGAEMPGAERARIEQRHQRERERAVERQREQREERADEEEAGLVEAEGRIAVAAVEIRQPARPGDALAQRGGEQIRQHDVAELFVAALPGAREQQRRGRDAGGPEQAGVPQDPPRDAARHASSHAVAGGRVWPRAPRREARGAGRSARSAAAEGAQRGGAPIRRARARADRFRSVASRLDATRRWLERRDRWLAAAIAAGGALLRLADLGTWWLNPDEGVHAGIAAAPSLALLASEVLAETNPPGLYGPLRLVAAFTSDPFALRVPSWLFGSLAVFGLFLAARRCYGPATGLIAAAPLALSPAAIVLSQIVRPYSMQIFAACFALWALLRSQDGGRRADAALYGGWLGLALFTHYGSTVLLAAATLWLAALAAAGALERGLARPLVAVHGALFALVAALYGLHFRAHLEGSSPNTWLATWMAPYLHESAGELWQAGLDLARYVFGERRGGLAALVFALGVAASLARRGAPRRFGLLALLGLAIAAALARAGRYPFGGTRHASHLVVFVIPIVAEGLRFAATRRGWRLAVAGAALAGLWLAPGFADALVGAPSPPPRGQLAVEQIALRREMLALAPPLRALREHAALVVMDRQTYSFLQPLLRDATPEADDPERPYRRFAFGRSRLLVSRVWQLSARRASAGTPEGLREWLREVGRGTPSGARGEVWLAAGGWPPLPFASLARAREILAGDAHYVRSPAGWRVAGLVRLDPGLLSAPLRAARGRPQRAGRRSADAQHDLAEVLAGLDEPVCLGSALERQHAVDDRPHATLRERRAKARLEGGDDAGLLRDGPRAQRRADQLQPAREQRAEPDLGLRAAHQADQHEAPSDRERGEVALEVGGADRVEDHVDATPVRERAAARDEVAGAVVDREIGAQREAARALLVGARRHRELRAGGLAELDRRGADAAAAAVHEGAAPRLERPELEHVQEDGQEDLGDRRRLLEREPLGHVQRRAGVDDDLLGVAASREQRHRALARAPARHALADLDHLARALEPEDRARARGRRIEPLALQQVGSVDRRRGDADAQRAALERRRRRVGEPHHGLVAEAVEHDRLHRARA